MPRIIGLMIVALMAISGLPATAQDTAKARIDLVYWSSKDCPYCRQGEGSLGAEGKLRVSPEIAKISFYTVKNDSLKQGYEQEHFPPQLAWLWERYRDGKIKHPDARAGRFLSTANAWDPFRAPSVGKTPIGRKSGS